MGIRLHKIASLTNYPQQRRHRRARLEIKCQRNNIL